MIYPKALVLFFCGVYLNTTVYAQIEHDSLMDLGGLNKELKFQDNFYEALKQKGIENFEKAISALEHCLEIYPNSAVVYYELGNVYLKAENYKESEKNLKKAINLDNENFWFKDKLYQLYLVQDNFDKAIEALLPILGNKQDYAEDLSYLYSQAGRYSEALAHIQTMDERFGYNSQRERLRIKIYKQTLDRKAHIKFLKHRLEVAPKNSDYFINLIYTLSEYGLESEAFMTAKMFLRSNPESHIAHAALYKFYLKEMDYDNAINSMKIVTESNILIPSMKLKVLRDFMDFVDKNPSYSDALMSIEHSTPLVYSERNSKEWGNYYLQKNQLNKAMEFFEKAFDEYSGDINIIKGLANLYLKTKQHQKALEFSLRQLELFPTQIELYLICGKSYFYFQNWKDALTIMGQGIDYIFEENQITIDYYELMYKLYVETNNLVEAERFNEIIKFLKSK